MMLDQDLLNRLDEIAERAAATRIGNRLDFLHETFERAQRAMRKIDEDFERRWAGRKPRRGS